MTLQAKLTLGYVLLAVLMVSIISAMTLNNDMQQQFDATLERADMLQTVAVDQVRSALNRQTTKPLREALRDPALVALFHNIMLASHAIIEVAVVDPNSDNEILLDSIPDQLGKRSPPYEDFRPLVTQRGWYEKVRVLLRRDIKYYQLQRQLEPPLLYVRVSISPELIYDEVQRRLKENAKVGVLSLIGAVCITFLFSTIAFRRLRHVSRMLDLAAAGEYQPDIARAKPATDELSVMASKVSLLSERLRGAHDEVSDLRGNIDHLLQDLEDAVFIFNRERRLVFASGSVEKFLGRDRGDLPGQSTGEIFPPSTTLGLLIAQASQTGRSVRNRRVPVSPPGEVAVTLAVVLLSVDMLETLPGGIHAGSGLLVRLRDPEAQRKLGRELQTADRLAAISRITGGVAHEVKNPLNAILLHVEVARAKLTRGDTDVAPQMEIISREILRLDRVVKTFLDFTRPVELSLSTVPLQQFMNEIVELARPQADASNIRVKMEQEAEGVEVRVDRDLLKQAVLNIVVNAMQAMPEGGELCFQALAHEDAAEIRISDTGAGIPEELREKIFRLYFTTKKDGSGIGLAMTFRIVQLHDGTIDFTSEPGKGTTFFIRLPIAV